MNLRMLRTRDIILGIALTLVLGAMVFVHAPAAGAAIDDSFQVESASSKCGAGGFAYYNDYGPGLKGGGNNDDYIEIGDSCDNGHGVKAWAWLNGYCLEGCNGQYHGYGAGNGIIIWDPFKAYGNVIRNDVVKLKICNVDGNNDPTPTGCDSQEILSDDG
jgi:hypothetical protein